MVALQQNTRPRAGRGHRARDFAVGVVHMANKLYVGNLPYQTTNEELQQTFSQAGDVVEAVVMMDKMTGRSRGFGFVVMANDEGAQKAIEMFNGKDFGGRNIVVNEARPLQPRAPRGDMGGGY